jgi:hypothetical protein
MMPIVRHRPSFSELISKAAIERKRIRRLRRIRGQNAFYSLRANNDFIDSLKLWTLIPRKAVYPILFLSLWCEKLLQSPAMEVVQAMLFAITFIAIAYETPPLSIQTKHEITLLNYCIDVYFLLDGGLKVASIFSGLIIHRVNLISLPFNAGLIELITALCSLLLGISLGGSWCRLIRVIVISANLVRHTAQLDVLLVFLFADS